jgi:hypothetical protein
MRPALACVLTAAAVAGCSSGDERRARPAQATSTPTATPTPAAVPAPPAGPALVSVRRRGGVPGSWAARARRAPGVSAVAWTSRAQALLVRSGRAGGATVDRAPAGYAFPLDALVVAPRAFARVLPEEARGAFRRLRPGRALLSEGSASLRRLEAGDRLVLAGGRTLRVAAVVDDDLVRGSEVVLGPRDGAGGRPGTRQLLVATERPGALARTLPRGAGRRLSAFGTPSGGGPSTGGIVRPLELKAEFGEFAVRLPYGEDWISIDPRWLRRNVVSRSVPILGTVTCHRRLIGPLRRALGTLRRRGLARVVDPGDYAGCFAPRRIPASGSLSLHAWGLAIDINAAANPQFADSRQDRRLVRAMEEAGFTWGGRWPTAPDPMHFELQGDG